MLWSSGTVFCRCWWAAVGSFSKWDRARWNVLRLAVVRNDNTSQTNWTLGSNMLGHSKDQLVWAQPYYVWQAAVHILSVCGDQHAFLGCYLLGINTGNGKGLVGPVCAADFLYIYHTQEWGFKLVYVFGNNHLIRNPIWDFYFEMSRTVKNPMSAWMHNGSCII